MGGRRIPKISRDAEQEFSTIHRRDSSLRLARRRELRLVQNDRCLGSKPDNDSFVKKGIFLTPCKKIWRRDDQTSAPFETSGLMLLSSSGRLDLLRMTHFLFLRRHPCLAGGSRLLQTGLKDPWRVLHRPGRMGWPHGRFPAWSADRTSE